MLNPSAPVGLVDFPRDAGPRALGVDSVSSAVSLCSTPGNQHQTFTFPASDNGGPGNIFWIQGIFSISGDDAGNGGPDNGYQGCHFIYYPLGYAAAGIPPNVIYLDSPGGWDPAHPDMFPPNWVGSSVVGSGDDLTNGYCTIHVPSSHVTTESYIMNLTLNIEFPASSTSAVKKHIYSVAANNPQPTSQTSNGGAWNYWGWWTTP